MQEAKRTIPQDDIKKMTRKSGSLEARHKEMFGLYTLHTINDVLSYILGNGNGPQWLLPISLYIRKLVKCEQLNS